MKTHLIISALFFLALQDVGQARPDFLDIIPGKSIGPVHIGDSRKKILNMGFKEDAHHDPEHFLSNGIIFARLRNRLVIGVTVKVENLNLLRFEGRLFPKKTDLRSMRIFLKNCDSEEEGSGGSLIFCANRTLILAYSGLMGFRMISVVSAVP